MLYKVKIFDTAEEMCISNCGVTFENVTGEGVIDIVKFALDYGKAISAVAIDFHGCNGDSCDV